MNGLLNSTFAKLPNGHVCVILKISGKVAEVRQVETTYIIYILVSELREL